MPEEIIDYLVDEEFDTYEVSDVVNPEDSEADTWN